MTTVLGRLLAALPLVLALGGCAAAASTASVTRQDTVVLGVKADQPGLAERASGGYRGFEVDFGTEVARRIGAKRVEYRTVTSEDRERLLNGHRVDLVLASYSITPERAAQVTFGGPYTTAHQRIMVRAGERGVGGVRDLAGRRLCEASGSVSTARIVQGLGIRPTLVPAASYSDCYAKLRSGEVDAVSTGDLVLAGFARRGGVRLVGDAFTDEPYGVGMRKGDLDGCEAVNKAITVMYQDGTAGRLLHRWFEGAGLRPVAEVPEFHGCS
ncbi:glutamate ABC transporter substrate-binding protein [Actinomadura parmotrematis]|uniref:Glutamate ABC transporter substrate-binding protein n=1 Tax=Actinomadura parmotrematis TaxID=2864039 RepID=A0ABS7G163_9ACTN|nr:glutamate ABC transporter substrate-binding protein [Actinomadura parmotrematis]MBW8486456.1 glutamate ABC transporter substrate-binding protein [Actinomadura parmotrematis]